MSAKSPARRFLTVACALAALSLGFWATYKGPIHPLLTRAPGTSSTQQYRAYDGAGGPQVLVVYFGSAHCSWSNDKAVPGLIQEIQLQARHRAAALGWSFEAIGVAVDWDPVEGVQHLQKTGRFDEMAAGANWTNSLVMRYSSENGEPFATPQVVVVRRFLRKPNSIDGVFNYAVRDESLLVRKVGLNELRQWVNAHVPIPGLESRSDDQRGKGAGSAL